MTVTAGGRALRLAVATPSHDGRVHVGHADTVRAIEIACLHSGVPFARVTGSGSQLARLRSRLAREALATRFADGEKGTTHVLFLDDDIALPQPDALSMLLSSLESVGAELAAPLCMVRPSLGDSTGRGLVGTTPERVCAGEHGEPTRFASAIMVADGTVHGLHAPDVPRPLTAPAGEMLMLGTGCLLIDTHAFERFAPDEDPFQFADGLGEDWWFCREVQRRGGRAVIDPRVATVHYGSTGWIWEGMR